MFGFSIPKLLVLFVIILVVWYFFKFIEKQNKLSKKRKDNVKKNHGNDESKFKKLGMSLCNLIITLWD